MSISRELYRQALLAGRLITFSSWDGGALRNLLPLSEAGAEEDSNSETSAGVEQCGPAATHSSSEASGGR